MLFLTQMSVMSVMLMMPLLSTSKRAKGASEMIAAVMISLLGNNQRQWRDVTREVQASVVSLSYLMCCLFFSFLFSVLVRFCYFYSRFPRDSFDDVYVLVRM